ncbi:glyoxalase [Chitinophaga cymbidii]|uniref:Glyoxalase n=2 Tax=Chitinophaga cymbidii TaxID=1096750 RepID=A0A512RLW9_9BACT|nr:glyoxalase [Chitinophaga cymbidii]
MIMIRFKRTDHIAITIPKGKTGEARAFYGGILQLKEIPGKHPNWATWFELGDIELHVVEEEGAHGLSARHAAFEVTDLEGAKAFLSAKGIDITYSSKITGRERFFFRDPFGNRIELLEYEA